jgi:hypothetical protein
MVYRMDAEPLKDELAQRNRAWEATAHADDGHRL